MYFIIRYNFNLQDLPIVAKKVTGNMNFMFAINMNSLFNK